MIEEIKKNAGLRWGLIIGIGFIFFLALKPFEIVDSGNRGVKVTMGSVDTTRSLEEGFHFKLPLVQSIKEVNVRVLKSETKADAASKDLQKVDMVIALNYHVSKAQVAKLYQEVGTDVESIAIDPAVQEVAKAVSAKYTAEQLITKRQAVSTTIHTTLQARLKKYHITIDDFSIQDFRFSDAFNHSIEEKQKTEQEALTEKNRLDKVKYQMSQELAKAKTEAKSLKVKARQITNKMLKMKWIEKWNGELPSYMMGGKSSSLLMQIPSKD